jgi:hypothetical protein
MELRHVGVTPNLIAFRPPDIWTLSPLARRRSRTAWIMAPGASHDQFTMLACLHAHTRIERRQVKIELKTSRAGPRAQQGAGSLHRVRV